MDHRQRGRSQGNRIVKDVLSSNTLTVAAISQKKNIAKIAVAGVVISQTPKAFSFLGSFFDKSVL